MIYQDAIYGIVEIEQPVLLALLASQAMRRLQGVLQHGISGLIGLTAPITRFEHSVGAMILVRRLGGHLDEQIAALLHDVSHTAFSHVIDYVFDGHDSQSYHDEMKESYLAKTDVPVILARFGWDWHDFLDEAAFPLLEQPSPRLCADRLDYFLRDSGPLQLAIPSDIGFVLQHLVVVAAGDGIGRIAVDDLSAARWLGDTFMAADEASWANFHEVGLYELTARAIRRGLTIGAIAHADIWTTDVPLWAKMKAHPDAELQTLIGLIRPDTEIVWDEKNPTFWVSTKLRSIDPDVLISNRDGLSASGSEVRPLSYLDPEFRQRRSEYHANKKGRWPMRVAGL